MKRVIMVIPIVLLLVSSMVVQVRAETFVGSKNSDVYHYPSCTYAKRIKAENLVYFSSAQDAVNHGYRPCKVCNPPLPAASTPSTSPTPTPEIPEMTPLAIAISLIVVTGIAIVAKKKRYSMHSIKRR